MSRIVDKEKAEVMGLYRRRAFWYDVTANMYYLFGFREWAYRKQAVDALHLRRGDTVVEIGCGTGLNFPLLQRAIGPEGKIIGVDLTDAMLAEARKRIERNGWGNVELIHGDAVSFRFPNGIGGVISTFALTLVPEYDTVIRNGYEALLPGKRWVILDLKIPSGRLSWLAPLGAFFAKPFGVSLDLAQRHPWESIAKHFKKVSFSERYAGFVYIAAGEK